MDAGRHDRVSAGGGPVVVVVADPRPLVADGLACILRAAEGVDVRAVVSSAAALQQAVEEHHPDVVVVGVVDGGSDEAVLGAVGGAARGARVLGVSPRADAATADRLLSAGVGSLLLATTASAEDLQRAVRAGPGPEVLAPADLARLVAVAGVEEPGQRPVPPLTPRQAQVLAELVRGRGTQQMATDLGLSATTVRSHVHQVLKRLGAHSRLEAAAIALRRGLLDPDRS